jgi:hypothetical protein
MLGHPRLDFEVKSILEAADQHTAFTKDSRMYCNLDEMLLLLKSGADICRLNWQQNSDVAPFLHIMLYKGREFVHATKKPIDASCALLYRN